ncbi:MAG TPA: ATP-grasp domain-containing protein [Pyrinomonadaceae bacterium]|nr:ATP-grasp domain-containing protein [Pyrinomonadaceae bacterium]
MPFVIYAAPWFSETAARFMEAVVGLEGVRLAAISQEPLEKAPPALREAFVAHWRVDDIFDAGQLAHAAHALSSRFGPIHRLFGANEMLQVPLADARAALGVEGMGPEAARNFRDKARMKAVLRAAGVPCARYGLAASEGDAWRFAAEVGYPLILKPPAGAGSQATYRVDNDDAMREALRLSPPGAGQPVLVEEFITGDEHSFETVTVRGRPVWHSLTHYYPTPLEVLRNPWVQWCIVLPREIDEARYDDIRAAAFRTLEALGMGSGMSHMEWFRRRDGSVAISEVGARPPGAQITTLVSRAHDFDFLREWARVMIYDEFRRPERRYAAGAAFLRGQGSGRVKAIHGLEQAGRELGELVVDVQLPQAGQAPTGTYEGEGYVILRHPETAVVERALHRLVSLIRVELG